MSKRELSDYVLCFIQKVTLKNEILQVFLCFSLYILLIRLAQSDVQYVFTSLTKNDFYNLSLAPSVLATVFVRGVWVLKQTFQHTSQFPEFLGEQHEIISKIIHIHVYTPTNTFLPYLICSETYFTNHLFK